MRNKELRNRRNDITQGWRALQSKGKEKKEVFTTRGIRSWSLIQVRTNFVERTRRGAVLVV